MCCEGLMVRGGVTASWNSESFLLAFRPWLSCGLKDLMKNASISVSRFLVAFV